MKSDITVSFMLNEHAINRALIHVIMVGVSVISSYVAITEYPRIIASEQVSG